MKKLSQPISRVLSRTIIHLGHVSPHGSSNLPGDSAGRIIAPLFDLAPGGVFPADAVTSVRGALLPHHFTLTGSCELRRYIFCGTFRGLTPPRRYLAPCPMEPGLSSMPTKDTAMVWPTRGAL